MKTGLGKEKGKLLKATNHAFVLVLHLQYLSPLAWSYREICKATDKRNNDNWRLDCKHLKLGGFARVNAIENGLASLSIKAYSPFKRINTLLTKIISGDCEKLFTLLHQILPANYGLHVW